MCALSELLLYVVNIYSILLFVYAVLSWIPDLRGRWTYYIAILIEPVLMPIRRVIPPLGGLDLAFLVLLLVLQLVIRPFLQQEVYHACFLY
ncbi:MAG: YggT family protein [Candidatus Eremiobacteraeota bacterium]|nr:YggT family protein [Candidatus Eremiobacteraeota bacterium]